MWQKVGEVVKLDETDYKATEGQISYIETLLITSNITREQEEGIFFELDTMSPDRAKEVIDFLKNNQRDAILSGDSYTVSEAAQKVQEKLNDPKS